MTTRWLSEDEQATWRAFGTVSRLIDAELDAQLIRDAGMGHTHYAILVTLSEANGGRMRMGDLAETLHFSPSRLSHAVARLERDGWVRRERCRTDGRGQEALLTDAGRNALGDAAPGHVDEVRRLLFDRLTAAERDQLRHLCESLLTAMAEEAHG